MEGQSFGGASNSLGTLRLRKEKGSEDIQGITLKTGGFEMEGKFLFVRLSLGATSCLFSF